MPDVIENLRRFLAELRRRNVYRVSATYLVVAFVGLQAVNLLIPATTLPGWADELLLALLIAGFPVAAVLAWAFETTPEGVRRTASPDSRSTAAGVSSWWLALPVSLAAAGGIWWAASDGSGTPPRAAATAADSAARETGRAAFPSPDRPFVAVLPLENMSPEEENEYFAAGVHEEILTHLSRISGLGVFARTTMRQYEDGGRSVFEIGRELGAEAVLEGSVRKSGDRVRITVQLIDPRSRDHLWAETYDRRLDDIFAVQTEIAERVAGALEATLSDEEEQRLAARPTESLDAYEFYLRGREAYKRYESGANEEAIRLFREALALDSTFALAWAGLGDALARRVARYGYPANWADSALVAARRAVDLDPELAEGHEALGQVYQVKGRPREGLEAYRRAAELDPNDHASAESIGGTYEFLGRYDEAIRWFRRSARLAPDDTYPRSRLAYAYTFLGMDATAKEWLRDALVLDPKSIHLRLLEAQHAVYREDTEGALAIARQVVGDAPDDPFAWTSAAGVAYMAREFGSAVEYSRESLRLAPENELLYWHYTETLLGLSLLKSGRGERGREVLRAAMDDDRRRIESGAVRPPRWDLAAAHAALGEREAALRWLERAYEAGFRHPRWASHDPAFDDLREEPRFRRLLERLEADVTRMRDRVRRADGLGSEAGAGT